MEELQHQIAHRPEILIKYKGKTFDEFASRLGSLEFQFPNILLVRDDAIDL